MHEPSPVETWEHLARVHRAATAAMDEHLRARFGHSLDDYDVLHQIAGHGAPINMGELASRLLVANSSCNRIVGRLEAAGLVERSRSETDRREVFAVLTAAGRRLRRRMATVHTRDIDQLIGDPLTPRQRVQLDAALAAVLAATEQPTDAGAT